MTDIDRIHAAMSSKPTDIVERLRDPNVISMAVRLEAAAEIERLLAALQEMFAECGGYTLDNDVAFRVASIARRALEPKP